MSWAILSCIESTFGCLSAKSLRRGAASFNFPCLQSSVRALASLASAAVNLSAVLSGLRTDAAGGAAGAAAASGAGYKRDKFEQALKTKIRLVAFIKSCLFLLSLENRWHLWMAIIMLAVDKFRVYIGQDIRSGWQE